MLTTEIKRRTFPLLSAWALLGLGCLFRGFQIPALISITALSVAEKEAEASVPNPHISADSSPP